MDFTQHCTDASAALLSLSTRIEAMEIQILRLEEDRSSTDTLTAIVTSLLETKDLSEELLYAQIPAIAADEPAVALAMRIAHAELMRRYWGIRDDLEVMTKVRKAPAKRGSNVVDFHVRKASTKSA